MVHYPIVLETEASGAVSAYVPGLPVYAAADSRAKAERGIRDVLSAYLEAHPTSRTQAQVRVARFSYGAKTRVDIVGVAARLAHGGARRRLTPRAPTDGLVVALARPPQSQPRSHARTRRSATSFGAGIVAVPSDSIAFA